MLILFSCFKFFLHNWKDKKKCCSEELVILQLVIDNEFAIYHVESTEVSRCDDNIAKNRGLNPFSTF